MAGQEDMESKRLLKPGDVRVALRPTGYFAAADTSERNLYKSSIMHSSGSSFQPLVRPSRSLTPTEPHFPHYYIRPTESHHYMTFSTQPKDFPQKPDSSVTNLLGDRRYILKSESETTLNSIFPPSAVIHPGTQAPFDFSTPSSPESDECLTYRRIPERQGTIRRSHPSYFSQAASTQTERSPFEEKFLFRESILLGCDLVSDLTCRFPHLEEVREWAEFVRDKTIQSRAQNVCSRLVQRSKEPQILKEYIKTFFRIADSWLDVRSCFGTSDQCWNETCCLDTRELTANYTEWMHVSRHLLNSIAKCLEAATKSKEIPPTANFNTNDSMAHGHITSKSSDQLPWPVPPRTPSDLIGSGGIWGYPPNPPCYCGINSSPPPVEQPTRTRTFPTNETNRFQGQALPIYPTHPRTYSDNDSTDTSDEHLKPSSYDVPRTNMSTTQRRHNISKAKSTCFKDRSVAKGYIITLVNSGNKKEEVNFEDKDTKDNSDGEEHSKPLEEIEASELAILTQDEWLFSQIKQEDGVKDLVKETDVEDTYQDSDDQGSLKEYKTDQGRGSPNRAVKQYKHGKGTARYVKRRLSHHDLLRIQDIVQALWKCDIPDHIKHPVKNTQQYYKIVKHPIFLETITNKTKNGVYETLEQFVHDCRRLILNASIYCQKENSEPEKIPKLSSKFENLLEDIFEQYESWTHISGDPKEMNYYPELRYTNAARKRSKLPKNQTNCEVTQYNKS